jgi:hypothetical protein
MSVALSLPAYNKHLDTFECCFGWDRSGLNSIIKPFLTFLSRGYYYCDGIQSIKKSCGLLEEYNRSLEKQKSNEVFSEIFGLTRHKGVQKTYNLFLAKESKRLCLDDIIREQKILIFRLFENNRILETTRSRIQLDLILKKTQLNERFFHENQTIVDSCSKNSETKTSKILTSKPLGLVLASKSMGLDKEILNDLKTIIVEKQKEENQEDQEEDPEEDPEIMVKRILDDLIKNIVEKHPENQKSKIPDDLPKTIIENEPTQKKSKTEAENSEIKTSEIKISVSVSVSVPKTDIRKKSEIDQKWSTQERKNFIVNVELTIFHFVQANTFLDKIIIDRLIDLKHTNMILLNICAGLENIVRCILTFTNHPINFSHNLIVLIKSTNEINPNIINVFTNFENLKPKYETRDLYTALRYRSPTSQKSPYQIFQDTEYLTAYNDALVILGIVKKTIDTFLAAYEMEQIARDLGYPSL